MNHPNPQDGGSYRRNPDGSLTQLSPTTGERPCKCRPQAQAPATPATALTGLGALCDAHDDAEAATEDQAPTTRRAKHKE